jgi:hypothetical protein
MGSRAQYRLPTVVGALFLWAPIGGAQVFVVGMKTATAGAVTEFHPTHVELPTAPLDEKGRMELIRDLEAEQGFAHRELPLGAGLTLLANGNMTPAGEDYRKMLYAKGESAVPGDRVEVSALQFHADRIIIDFNGGPYAKHRFLSHISINDMPLAQQGPMATGCRVTLIFEGGVPEVSAAEVKALLDPIVDFKAKSSVEAYADTLPPKVRAAIEAHQVLVGMDRRMVLAAVGEPKTKHREHAKEGDSNSSVWEEWIYGETPQPIQFVRFREGRVIRLEIAELGKPPQIHDRDELGNGDGPVLQPRIIANGDQQPTASADTDQRTKAPTLRRPDDKVEAAPSSMGKVRMPDGSTTQPPAKPSAGAPTAGTPAATTPAPASAPVTPPNNLGAAANQ